MALSRRNFLRIAAGAGAAFGLGGSIANAGNAPSIVGSRRAGTPTASVRGAGNPLRFPPTFSGGTLAAAVGQKEVWPGAQTEVWTLGGSYPGPTVRMESGGTFTARFENGLQEMSNIHWHGLLVPAGMDGHPRDAVEAGRTFDYSFTVEQRAGTYWYHPHPDMSTAKQVYKGMAGFFIVSDAEEQALGLPSGEFDVPLLLQDRRLEDNRSFRYEVMHMDHVHGYLGDVALVNGTPEAFLEVARGLYRFRLLNGSNARVFQVALAGKHPFHVIGTDGGLLDKPYRVTEAYLAPAERLDILVDFSDVEIGQSLQMYSVGYSGQSGRNQGAEMPLLRFDVNRGGGGGSIPQQLATLDKLDPGTAAQEREFILQTDETKNPPEHKINGKTFEMVRIDESVKLGDIEVWTFQNTTPVPHPMHLHGAQFQILEVGGSEELLPEQLGWKDTVYVPPHSNARVVVKFGKHSGVFLVHCHNLEHEDHGMMQNFELVQNSAVEHGAPLPTRMDLR